MNLYFNLPGNQLVSFHQMTPLHVATQRGDRISIVNYLVDKGADINKKDNNGVSKMVIGYIYATIILTVG